MKTWSARCSAGKWIWRSQTLQQSYPHRSTNATACTEDCTFIEYACEPPCDVGTNCYISSEKYGYGPENQPTEPISTCISGETTILSTGDDRVNNNQIKEGETIPGTCYACKYNSWCPGGPFSSCTGNRTGEGCKDAFHWFETLQLT